MEIHCSTVIKHEKICIAGLNRRAGYATVLMAWVFLQVGLVFTSSFKKLINEVILQVICSLHFEMSSRAYDQY